MRFQGELNAALDGEKTGFYGISWTSINGCRDATSDDSPSGLGRAAW